MGLLEYQAMPSLRDVDHDGVSVSVIHYMTAACFLFKKMVTFVSWHSPFNAKSHTLLMIPDENVRIYAYPYKISALNQTLNNRIIGSKYGYFLYVFILIGTWCVRVYKKCI
jgi:hypothetical protein